MLHTCSVKPSGAQLHPVCAMQRSCNPARVSTATKAALHRSGTGCCGSHCNLAWTRQVQCQADRCQPAAGDIGGLSQLWPTPCRRNARQKGAHLQPSLWCTDPLPGCCSLSCDMLVLCGVPDLVEALESCSAKSDNCLPLKTPHRQPMSDDSAWQRCCCALPHTGLLHSRRLTGSLCLMTEVPGRDAVVPCFILVNSS